MVHDVADELICCNILFTVCEQQNKRTNNRNHNGEMARCQGTYAIFIIVKVIEVVFVNNIINPLVLPGQ